jgi:hypothetical protein
MGSARFPLASEAIPYHFFDMVVCVRYKTSISLHMAKELLSHYFVSVAFLVEVFLSSKLLTSLYTLKKV